MDESDARDTFPCDENGARVVTAPPVLFAFCDRAFAFCDRADAVDALAGDTWQAPAKSSEAAMGRLSSELLQSFQPLGIVGHLLPL